MCSPCFPCSRFSEKKKVLKDCNQTGPKSQVHHIICFRNVKHVLSGFLWLHEFALFCSEYDLYLAASTCNDKSW